jgi:hypothetical protein
MLNPTAAGAAIQTAARDAAQTLPSVAKLPSNRRVVATMQAASTSQAWPIDRVTKGANILPMTLFEVEPFTCWRCDECAQPIASVLDGWVEWRVRDGVLCDFRIVHHVSASPRGELGCYGEDIAGNMLMEETLGADGLAWLLGVLAKAPVDRPQFAELIRRLQLPFYEFARTHVVDPQSFETNGVREYTQAGIAAKMRIPAIS